MTETITLTRVTSGLDRLSHAFQFGQSVERPGIIDAAHTATWHMAEMIERLRELRTDQVEALRRGELPERPVSSEGQTA